MLVGVVIVLSVYIQRCILAMVLLLLPNTYILILFAVVYCWRYYGSTCLGGPDFLQKLVDGLVLKLHLNKDLFQQLINQ